MKHRILCLALVFSFTCCCAQQLSLSNMVNLLESNWDSYDSFVISKGYTYNKSDEKEFSVSRTYSFSTNKYNRNYATNWIEKTNYSNGTILVSWTTYNILNYSAIKLQAKQQGFKFIGDNIKDGVSSLRYKKGNIELSLFSQEITTNEGISANGYEISVLKRNND